MRRTVAVVATAVLVAGCANTQPRDELMVTTDPMALAFLKQGRARHGEVVRMVDHLRGIEAMCEVCDPVFFDKDGGRARG